MKTFLPTKNDIVAAFNINATKNPNYSKIRTIISWKWWLLAIGSILIVISVIALKLKFPVYIYIVLFLLGYVPFIMGTLAIFKPFLIKKTALKQWNKNPTLHNGYTLSWNDKYLIITTEQEQSEIRWSAYCQMLEDDNYILIYYQKSVFIIISKQLFENEEEKQDFYNKLQAGIELNKLYAGN